MKTVLVLPFHLAARHGRWCLVLGLLAGLLFADLAAAIRPLLPELVALLIFVAAFRIGPRKALGGIRDIPGTALLICGYQVALPLLALGIMAVCGLAGSALALAIVLMLSAPSVTGSPNFTILLGHHPAPALRLLILGTAFFPFSSLPVLSLLPGLQGVSVLDAALRLLAAIGIATAAAFLLRGVLPDDLGADAERATDGASAILLAVVVVGLMSALGPALRTDPVLVAGWLAVATTANLGLQAASFLMLGRRSGAVPLAIVAGNRNVALFLVALPPETTAPLLIFIGCYQIPMYLTPILMARVYGSASRE